MPCLTEERASGAAHGENSSCLFHTVVGVGGLSGVASEVAHSLPRHVVSGSVPLQGQLGLPRSTEARINVEH